ncbi:acyltransferase [Neorhizobium lilium]|uniref:Acyltransferase n=1 Tax=Neorhizobium lilium TaxID=2503024 RepID=A0A3S3VEU3_9HYPH|nr:acyltransferase [Neorhizobium lilium]RWX75033.1 acyltransferase [Neorhizobium lilium]
MVKQSERLLNLDLLRLASALMVLLFHYGFRMRISGEGGGVGFPELAPMAVWGDVGLLIFFAISGYVITMSAEGRSAYAFAAGRIGRLWPTFMVCATITAIVLTFLPVPTLPAPTLGQWLAHVFIISRALGQPFLDGAYWTIAYEIIFYGWIFLLIAVGIFERYWRVIVTIWLALSVLNESLIHSGALEKLLITSYSGYFAFGLALFRLRMSFSWTGAGVLLAAACWAAATPFLTEPEFVATYGMDRSMTGLLLMGPVALVAVAIAALLPSLPIKPALAVTLGGLTYPLYLLHQNIGYAVFANFGTTQSRWLLLGAILTVITALSLAISKTVEPPARRAIIAASLRLQARLSRSPQKTA